MFDVGGGELIVVLLVILLLFGPKKIPEFAQMVGKGLRKFRMAQEELTQQIRDISAEAAIHDDDFNKKSTTPEQAIDVTKPIVVPKPADDAVSRNTPHEDVAVTSETSVADNATPLSDVDSEHIPPDDREDSPS